MSYRFHATRVIAKKRLFEVLINPGFYIALSVSLLLAVLLISGFMDSIGSSGFKPELNPFYNMMAKGIAGVFGETFLVKLFNEGPYLFTLVISFFPVLIYLAVSVVFKFGLEKNIGAIELVTYGPADGISYSLGLFTANIILTLLYMVVLFVFLLLSSLLNNLLLGPVFFYAFFLIFFLAIAVYSFAIIVSVLTDNAASGITLFLVIFVLFILLQLGSFALVSGYVKDLAGVLAAILQWFSPLFYWARALDFVEFGKVGGYFLNILSLLGLSVVLLFASHLILKIKGVRG